jgi:hypothetical protein
MTARYRDPATGLAYATQYAYGELKKLRKENGRWSTLLGDYITFDTGVPSDVPQGIKDVISGKG